MASNNFSYHLARSDLQDLVFGDCTTCHESVIRSVERKTQKAVVLDPKPVSAPNAVNASYSRHICPRVPRRG